ncbi:hypothetical protein [Nannocystis punicea]|uniref:Uncharacterized protein n=1 Tax=Nannocystis punicea TaxID=2995304 RepID=A0ABY7GT09_9BACT|nr:hypothetical protein [Nannocystis poenicansa]WAS90082.1 hypothetical protein O0S08_28135 [Nannocystis poenicansa]
MAKDKCCIEPADLRVLTLDTASEGVHIVYTVPAGRVFVVTSWTMSLDGQATATARMLRSGSRVAVNRIFESLRQLHHLTFPTGIAFAAGQDIVVHNTFNWAQHTLHGYEVDD